MGIADLLIKEGVINVNFMMTTWRFTDYQKMLKTKIFVKD